MNLHVFFKPFNLSYYYSKMLENVSISPHPGKDTCVFSFWGGKKSATNSFPFCKDFVWDIGKILHLPQWINPSVEKLSKSFLEYVDVPARSVF